MNAVPVVIDLSEAYLALSEHAVDAVELPLISLVAGKFYEVATHVSLTNFVYNPGALLAGKRSLDRLSPAYQTAIREAALAISPVWRTTVAQKTEDAIAFVKTKGCTVAAVDRPAYAAALQPVYAQFGPVVGEALLGKSKTRSARADPVMPDAVTSPDVTSRDADAVIARGLACGRGPLPDARLVAAAALIVELVVVLFTIIERSLFDRSILWNDEASRLALSIITFIGGAVSYRGAHHSSIRLITDRLSTSRRQVIAIGIEWLVLSVTAAAGLAVARPPGDELGGPDADPPDQHRLDRAADHGGHGAYSAFRARAPA